MVLIIATMHLFDTKFLYFNSGTCVLVHFHLVVPPGVNLTLVCKNSLRICEKKNSSYRNRITLNSECNWVEIQLEIQTNDTLPNDDVFKAERLHGNESTHYPYLIQREG